MHCEGVELREEKLEGRVQRDFVGGKESWRDVHECWNDRENWCQEL
jgi:hypothetical protein